MSKFAFFFALSLFPAIILSSAAEAPEFIQHDSRVTINTHYPMQAVQLRKFPYPYQAMLAIDSDADHATLRKFNLVHQFLNTFDETIMGRGLGLDVSDSFFLYNGSNLQQEIDLHGMKTESEMTFFRGISEQPYYAPVLMHYLKVGWIDAFHSVGDYTRINAVGTMFTRQQAIYAINYLLAHGIHVPVFTDHGNQSNVANFGSFGYQNNVFFNYQQGGNPYSPFYVADLIRKVGVKFIWADVKNNQYSYPSMLYPIQLRDGHRMWGFWRFTGNLSVRLRSDDPWPYYWHDLWNPYDLYLELAPKKLEDLIRTHGYTILAQHLEGNADRFVFSTRNIEALTRLAHMQEKGLILVARTVRLLNYNLAQKYLRYKVEYYRGITYIDIQGVDDPVDGVFEPTWDQLRGITFVVRDPQQAEILRNGLPIPPGLLKITPHTIGVSWYPPDVNDYSINAP